MSTLAASRERNSGLYGLERANSIFWGGASQPSMQNNIASAILNGLDGAITFESYRDSLRMLREAVDAACLQDPSLIFAAQVSAAVAKTLLLGRPLDVPVPDIDVWDSGKVAFEWYRNPNNVLTLTIDDRRRVVFSAHVREARLNGVMFIGSEWPDTLVTLVKKVIG